MGRKNQYRLSIAAMSIGLLMLSLFLGWWLMQSWSKEEQRFGAFVDNKLETTVQIVEDSISTIKIMSHINPQNYEGSSFKVFIKSNRIKPYYQQNSDDATLFFQKTVPSITINTNKVIKREIDTLDFKMEFNSTDNDFLSIDSLASTIDIIKSENNLFNYNLEPIDSLLVRFSENFRLEDKYPSGLFTTVDIALAKERFSKGLSRAFIYTDGKALFAVQFPNYRWYIFKELLPEFLFSILLLGLLGVAFFLINKSLLEQERLSKIKNNFISNITHELKTPITTVSVALEALENFNAMDDPERSKEYIKISKGELNRLSILVDNVLKMSIFEEKQPIFKKENLDIKTVCKEVLSSMQLQFEKKRARVDFEATGQSFLAKADKVHFTNVVYNLIENALKYNGQSPHIQIRLKDSARHLHIEVEDNGIGIAKEYQDKVFGKFFRVPAGDTHNYKGHGLGLTYVANVVEAHGGIIVLESELDQGTTFTITLPKTQNI